MVSAHNGPITAVAVNSDGKYVATFSHIDNKLRFWQVCVNVISQLTNDPTSLFHYCEFFGIQGLNCGCHTMVKYAKAYVINYVLWTTV